MEKTAKQNKLQERGLSFEIIQNLSTSRVKKLQREMGDSCRNRFHQFLNHTQQNSNLENIEISLDTVASISPEVPLQLPQVNSGELRSASKCKNAFNGEVPVYSQAQEFIDGGFL